MSSLDIISAKISNLFETKNNYAVSEIVFYEPAEIHISNMAKFASLVSSKLPFQNWFLCADVNYFVIEKDDKYVVSAFYTDIYDDSVEVIIKKCNTEQELTDLILTLV